MVFHGGMLVWDLPWGLDDLDVLSIYEIVV